MSRNCCGIAVLALVLGCASAVLSACGSEPVERTAEDAVEDVDRGLGAMREENQRRIRQIAESSREMEEDRQRTLERARARAQQRE